MVKVSGRPGCQLRFQFWAFLAPIDALVHTSELS